MAKILRYHVIFRPEPEGGFTVLVPSLSGCITWGKDIEEAKKMAQEAVELYIESLRDDGEEIPVDSGILTGSLDIPFESRRKPVHA